ncbi:MAG: hypothetical protein WCD86_11960 [Ktedonobacteraceae bacterium]
MELNFYVDETQVGAATMPCVPRIGEEVHLWLSQRNTPDHHVAVRFRIEQIQYICYNTLPNLEWIVPYTDDSREVFIFVTPLDAETQAYVNQVKALEGK